MTNRTNLLDTTARIRQNLLWQTVIAAEKAAIVVLAKKKTTKLTVVADIDDPDPGSDPLHDIDTVVDDYVARYDSTQIDLDEMTEALEPYFPLASLDRDRFLANLDHLFQTAKKDSFLAGIDYAAMKGEFSSLADKRFEIMKMREQLVNKSFLQSIGFEQAEAEFKAVQRMIQEYNAQLDSLTKFGIKQSEISALPNKLAYSEALQLLVAEQDKLRVMVEDIRSGRMTNFADKAAVESFLRDNRDMVVRYQKAKAQIEEELHKRGQFATGVHWQKIPQSIEELNQRLTELRGASNTRAIGQGDLLVSEEDRLIDLIDSLKFSLSAHIQPEGYEKWTDEELEGWLRSLTELPLRELEEKYPAHLVAKIEQAYDAFDDLDRLMDADNLDRTIEPDEEADSENTKVLYDKIKEHKDDLFKYLMETFHVSAEQLREIDINSEDPDFLAAFKEQYNADLYEPQPVTIILDDPELTARNTKVQTVNKKTGEVVKEEFRGRSGFGYEDAAITITDTEELEEWLEHIDATLKKTDVDYAEFMSDAEAQQEALKVQSDVVQMTRDTVATLDLKNLFLRMGFDKQEYTIFKFLRAANAAAREEKRLSSQSLEELNQGVDIGFMFTNPDIAENVDTTALINAYKNNSFDVMDYVAPQLNNVSLDPFRQTRNDFDLFVRTPLDVAVERSNAQAKAELAVREKALEQIKERLAAAERFNKLHADGLNLDERQLKIAEKQAYIDLQEENLRLLEKVMETQMELPVPDPKLADPLTGFVQGLKAAVAFEPVKVGKIDTIKVVIRDYMSDAAIPTDIPDLPVPELEEDDESLFTSENPYLGMEAMTPEQRLEALFGQTPVKAPVTTMVPQMVTANMVSLRSYIEQASFNYLEADKRMLFRTREWQSHFVPQVKQIIHEPHPESLTLDLDVMHSILSTKDATFSWDQLQGEGYAEWLKGPSDPYQNLQGMIAKKGYYHALVNNLPKSWSHTGLMEAIQGNEKTWVIFKNDMPLSGLVFKHSVTVGTLARLSDFEEFLNAFRSTLSVLPTIGTNGFLSVRTKFNPVWLSRATDNVVFHFTDGKIAARVASLANSYFPNSDTLRKDLGRGSFGAEEYQQGGFVSDNQFALRGFEDDLKTGKARQILLDAEKQGDEHFSLVLAMLLGQAIRGSKHRQQKLEEFLGHPLDLSVEDIRKVNEQKEKTEPKPTPQPAGPFAEPPSTKPFPMQPAPQEPTQAEPPKPVEPPKPNEPITPTTEPVKPEPEEVKPVPVQPPAKPEVQVTQEQPKPEPPAPQTVNPQSEFKDVKGNGLAVGDQITLGGLRKGNVQALTPENVKLAMERPKGPDGQDRFDTLTLTWKDAKDQMLVRIGGPMIKTVAITAEPITEMKDGQYVKPKHLKRLMAAGIDVKDYIGVDFSLPQNSGLRERLIRAVFAYTDQNQGDPEAKKILTFIPMKSKEGDLDPALLERLLAMGFDEKTVRSWSEATARSVIINTVGVNKELAEAKKDQLMALGWSEADIAGMTPVQIMTILGVSTKKPTSAKKDVDAKVAVLHQKVELNPTILTNLQTQASVAQMAQAIRESLNHVKAEQALLKNMESRDTSELERYYEMTSTRIKELKSKIVATTDIGKDVRPKPGLTQKETYYFMAMTGVLGTFREMKRQYDALPRNERNDPVTKQFLKQLNTDIQTYQSDVTALSRKMQAHVQREEMDKMTQREGTGTHSINALPPTLEQFEDRDVPVHDYRSIEDIPIVPMNQAPEALPEFTVGRKKAAPKNNKPGKTTNHTKAPVGQKKPRKPNLKVRNLMRLDDFFKMNS